MAVATHLVDTSVVNRLHNADVEAVVVPMLERGLAATCGTLNLEALYSARSPEEYAAESTYRSSVLEYVDTDEADFARAQEVQARLAARSAHRGAKLPDLIVAAVAERHRLVVLHYDSDFDLIAGVTGQRVEWVVPRGSVP